MIKTIIDEFILKTCGDKLTVQGPTGKTKQIPIDKFLESGMMLLPKKLYDKIRTNLRAANQYDKFMDKIYDSYQ